MEFSNLAALAVLCVRRMRRNRRRSESGQQVRPRTLVLPRAPRVVRERVTLDGMTDAQIVETYRLNRQQLNDLYELLKDDLEPRKCMRTAIPGMSKMLCCLHFLASGSFQTAEGRMGGVAQSSFSKVLFNFLKAMRDKCHQFIGFPTTPQGWRKLKRGFFELGGIPNVVGAIHCTHIVMRAPANQGQVYMNRKNVHSLNVQVVCDAKMRIMNVFTSFPGIPHGSYILQNSSVAHNFETGEFPQGWLLGDTGYPLKTWLMTPCRETPGQPEILFNQAHQKARSVIERLFEVLKMRFKCLDKSGGTLQYEPDRVAMMVVACSMLHNIAVIGGLIKSDELDVQPELTPPDECPVEEVEAEEDEAAVKLREEVIQEFFGDQEEDDDDDDDDDEEDQ